MNKSIFLISILVLLMMTGQVNALEARIGFHVSVAENDVVHPGDDTVLTLLIENDGRLTTLPSGANITQLTQLLTMVKDLSVEIEDKSVPIKVKTVNPQFIGDIPAGRVLRVNFRVEVPLNAEPGSYRIPVKLKYTKISYDQDFSGIHFSYLKDLIDTEYITLKIERKDYDFGVISVKSSLKTNQEGLVEVAVENTGKKELLDANLILNCSYPLKSNPGAISAYIGDVNPGDRVGVKFRVYAMDGAINRTYPATLILSFRTSSGVPMMISRSIGLDVSDESSFAISDVESFITSSKTIPKQQQAPLLSGVSLPRVQSQQKTGQEYTTTLTIPSRGFVSVSIKDVGRDVSDVVAFLHFDNPLIQVENSPSLGYFKKGDVKRALFYVKSAAPPGRYRGYVLLRYMNELGDEEITGKHYVEIDITPSSPLAVEKVETRNLGVGLKGSIAVSIKNYLTEPVSDVMFYIISPDPSIIPLSSSTFVERIDPGYKENIKFRLLVSDEASNGYYNLYIVERYNAGDARDLVSIVESPVFVESKGVHFEITSVKSNLYPDETGEIILNLKNAGSMDIHNAVVRLEVSPPLTMVGGSAIGSMVGQSQPGLYFIGTLKPQETATARFRVDVDKDAGPGNYPITVRIEYYDDEGYPHISNPITGSVIIKERPLITPLMAGAIVISASGLILAGMFMRKRLKREREN